MAQIEIPQDLRLLDSNQPEVVEAAKKRFHEFFNSTKDSFLVNGLIDYYVSTGCVKCVDVLVGVREPHETYFFNKMAESLKNTNPTTRLNVLTLLSHIVMRQPTWLFKIAQHNAFKELLKILKTESDIVNLVSALLTFVMLLPMVPAYVGATLPDIFEIFSRLAAWNTTNPNKLLADQLVHLQISLHYLFYRLYGMYPCNFLSYLRQQYGARENLAIFSHTIKPMLDTVKMHPLLVTTSKETETTTNRWKTMEHHDVVVECAKLSVDARDDSCPPAPTTFRARSESELRRVMEVSGYQELKAAANVSGEITDLWDERITIKSVPVTPLPIETSSPAPIPLTPIAQAHIGSTSFPHEIGTSPPEAAVEATPETTPVKDPRVYRSSQPPNPAVVRALNQLGTPKWSTSTTPTNSQPSSPMKKDPSPFRFPGSDHGGHSDVVQRKLHSVLQDRRLAHRAVNGGRGVEDHLEGGSQEDQEVLEISQQGELSLSHSLGAVRECDSVLQDFHPPHGEDDELCEQESGSPCNSGGLHMPNTSSLLHLRKRLRHYSQCAADAYPHTIGGTSSSNGGLSSLVRRAHSCPDIKKKRPSFTATDAETTVDENVELETATASIGTQTLEDLLPFYPYDHMLLGLISQPPTNVSAPLTTRPRGSPSLMLDEYVSLATQQREDGPRRSHTELEKTGREQLILVQLLLQFERHRRDIHAERNRRLLGKSRMNRQLEEHNSALRDQLALLEAEIDSLHAEIAKIKDDRRKCERNMLDDLDGWKDQYVNVEKQNRELKSENQRLFQELEQKRAENKDISKKLQQVEAMYFTVGHELQEVRAQASAGETLRGQVAGLQRDLLVMGEQRARSSNQLARMTICSNKSKQLLHESFQQQVRSLSGKLDAKTLSCEALKARVTELEAAIGRKDMHINEQKRTLKAAKEECREQLEAVETKYKSEIATNRKLECHVMELTSKLENASRRPRRNVSYALDVVNLDKGGINSPLSLSLSSSDGFSLSSTLMTDSVPPRDLQAVLDGPEASCIPEIPEFDDLPGPSHEDNGM